LKVANQRTDFLHKLTSSLWKDNAIICGERLNIKNMVQSNLAKHILDVSWGRFYSFLQYKAVTCGGELRKNPKTRGSSHTCSNCGFYVEAMPLSKRTFKCPKCGFVCHRDNNSAINHINDTDGLSGISTPVETPPLSLRFAKACGVIESGTIFGK
jgi:putative transposase